jgi:hypothetical protein
MTPSRRKMMSGRHRHLPAQADGLRLGLNPQGDVSSYHWYGQDGEDLRLRSTHRASGASLSEMHGQEQGSRPFVVVSGPTVEGFPLGAVRSRCPEVWWHTLPSKAHDSHRVGAEEGEGGGGARLRVVWAGPAADTARGGGARGGAATEVEVVVDLGFGRLGEWVSWRRAELRSGGAGCRGGTGPLQSAALGTCKSFIDHWVNIKP